MFTYYNANPYGRHISDCVIRALSVLTDRTWNEVYDEMTDLAGDVGMMFDRVEFVEDYLDSRYDREKHYSKTVGELTSEFPIGRYAITMDGHITATFNPSNRVVRCVWKIR